MLKKIIYLIVSGGLLLSGCSLDYEPLNGPSSGSFPASEEEAMAGLYAAYKGLANMTVKETPFPMRINDCISDIGTYRTGAGNQIKAMSSTLTADNTMCKKVYKTVYKIAGRVHLVLDNLDRLRGVIPEDRFNQIKAELLCIRAYYYDLGCQFYGDIPFIDHQLDLDDYSDYPRIPREQVTARLLQDLDDDLLDYLPVQWNPGTYGTTRIGRVAAYALKARIALNWGLWEEAARCSKIATTLAEGVYDLEPLDCTYYATHADGEPSAANLFGFAGQTSREWLWAIQYNRLINYTSATYYEAPRIHGGCSWLGPSQAMVDTFQCTDGKPITESPLYDWQNPWANRDPRLDLFCLRPDTRLWGSPVRHRRACRKGEGLQPVDGGQRGAHQQRRRRGQQERVCGQRQQGARRLSVAQVLRQGDDGTGQRYEDGGRHQCGNHPFRRTAAHRGRGQHRVGRRRSGDRRGEHQPGARPCEHASRDRPFARGLAQGARYERKAELCNEGFRWFDIRRWKIASKAVNGPMYAPGYSTVQNPETTSPTSGLRSTTTGW